MQYRVEEIVNYVELWAKREYEESWDNSGAQIYFKDEAVENVVVSLDLFDEVVDMAIEKNAKLIITHHPMFFSSIKSIDNSNYIGKNIIKAIKNDISIYSAHTTLDIAEGGVNDLLCSLLKLDGVKGLYRTENGFYLGKTGRLKKKTSLEDFVELLKITLNTKNIRVYGKKTNFVEQVSLCGGSGSDFISLAAEEKSDVYITGDIKYHDGQRAYEEGITLIDIGHFNGEKIIVNEIKKYLENKFKINIYPIIKNNYEISFDDMDK